MSTLEGKVALITGAARGQGRSHAIRLAEDGADIIAIDFDGKVPSVPYALSGAEDLAETVNLVEKTGRRIVSYTADVRDGDALDKAARDGVGELGRIDIVCANAGVLSYGASWELTSAQWKDTIDINLTGVWNTVHAALPTLIAEEKGCIILTSSMAGLRGASGALPYVAAKWGIVGMTRTLAIELGPKNIRVNAVHPTTVYTDMVTHEATYKLFRPELENPQMSDCEELFYGMQTLPIPWIEPSDVSAAISWLASDEARYVTGISLPIDGGAAIK
jgi:(+)-trans-carveol dehydrogenase